MKSTEPVACRPAGSDSGLHTELIRLSRTLHALRATAGKDSSLHQGAVPFLAILAESGSMRSRDLAAATFLDPSTVSRQVDALVRDGYVRRVVDPQDGRASLLEMTPEGAGALEERRRTMDAILADVIGGWPRAHLDQLVGLLATFNDDAAGHLPALRAHSSSTATEPLSSSGAGTVTIKERNA